MMNTAASPASTKEEACYLTTCSKEKRRDPGVMPAARRYLTPRIAEVQALARRDGTTFRIFSGEYGILAPDDLIPWYDHLLTEAEAPGMANKIVEQLTGCPYKKLVLFTGDPAEDPNLLPYISALGAASRRLNRVFDHRILARPAHLPEDSGYNE